MTFSKILPVADKRFIGHKFLGNFVSSPVFGKIVVFASFQAFGKRDNRRQSLNKCVIFTSGRFGKYLRHSFEKTSIPQNFFDFNEFINFRMSQSRAFSKRCRLQLQAVLEL
jgi:hypothetical protein